MSPTELAKLSGLSADKIYRLLNKGMLAYTPINGSNRKDVTLEDWQRCVTKYALNATNTRGTT